MESFDWEITTGVTSVALFSDIIDSLVFEIMVAIELFNSDISDAFPGSETSVDVLCVMLFA